MNYPVAYLAPRSPLFWVKKEEFTEGRKPGRACKTQASPLSPGLAKGLDPPLLPISNQHKLT